MFDLFLFEALNASQICLVEKALELVTALNASPACLVEALQASQMFSVLTFLFEPAVGNVVGLPSIVFVAGIIFCVFPDTLLFALFGHSVCFCLAAEGKSGSLLALQLTFQLPPSCYATMLIRELTKMATGTAFHRSLTQVT